MTRRAVIWLAAAMAAGCVGVDEAQRGDGQRINGTADFSDGSCSTAQQDLIRDALAIAFDQVVTNNGLMTACLRSAQVTPQGDSAAEQFVAAMGANLPTTFRCQDSSVVSCGGLYNWNACASVGISTEEVRINHDFLTANASNAARVASVILHEVAHNKGFSHLSSAVGEYALSWSEQSEQCSLLTSGVGGLSPNGLSRYAMDGESEMMSLGGDTDGGGALYSLWCPVGEHVVGFATALSGSGNTGQIARLRVRCRAPAGTTLHSYTAGSAGAIGAGQNCASDQVATAVLAQATDSGVYRLAFECSPVSSVQAGQRPVAQTLAWQGFTSGVLSARYCPSGTAIRAVTGRLGASLDELRVVCGDIGALTPTPPSRLTVVNSTISGATEGWNERETCSDHGVAVGLFAYNSSGIARIGSFCRAVSVVGGSLVERPGSVEHLAVGQGSRTPQASGQPMPTVDGRCASGYALVGAHLGHLSSGRLGVMAGICANIGSWSAGVTATTNLAILGGGGATRPPAGSSQRKCAARSFLVGFETRSVATSSTDRWIEDIYPLCRRFQ